MIGALGIPKLQQHSHLDKQTHLLQILDLGLRMGHSRCGQIFFSRCKFFEIAVCSDSLLFINLWNTFNRTDQELPRTNNSIEGWHQNFQGHLSACHPNFWKFINVLKKEEAYVRVSILQHQGGQPVKPKFLRIIDDYPNRQLLDYLRNIAQNIAF